MKTEAEMRARADAVRAETIEFCLGHGLAVEEVDCDGTAPVFSPTGLGLAVAAAMAAFVQGYTAPEDDDALERTTVLLGYVATEVLEGPEDDVQSLHRRTCHGETSKPPC